MSYLRTIAKSCQKCGRLATVELLNMYNSSCGFYCDKCGKSQLKQLKLDEECFQRMQLEDKVNER